MTGVSTTARSEAAALLRAAAGEVPVIANVPERLNPPCIVLTEGAPLAEHSDTFASMSVNFTVNVVAAPVASNSAVIERLDALVDKLILHLVREGITFSVDSYSTVSSADSQAYLACPIHISLSYSL